SGAFSLNPATQSFGIDLPKGMTGNLHLALDAIGDDGTTVLASGSGDAAIKNGGRVDLPIALTSTGSTNDMPDMATPPDLTSTDMAMPSTATAALSIDRATQKFGEVTQTKTSNAVMIKVTNSGAVSSGALAFASSGTDL